MQGDARFVGAAEVRSVHGGMNTSGRCGVDGPPEALQLGLRQHLSQFDHARHVVAVIGQVVVVETAR